MQSVYVARLLLNGVAFLLALRASSLSAWSIVEPVAMYEHSAPAINPAKTDLATLTFAPSEYCLDYNNGSNVCHPYAYLLTHSESPVNITALHGGLEPESLVAASSVNRLESAVSGWCMGSSMMKSSSSSQGSDGSWILQGAQSVLCLVVLETCVYTKVLWLLLAFSSTIFSLFTVVKWTSFEGCAGFSTHAQAALSVLMLIEWWGYSVYMMDLGVIAMLQLVVHYGISMRYTVLAMVSALLACHASAQISSPLSALNMAKLHALPASLRPRRRQPSPREGASPESVEDSTLGCLEDATDPLKCPANYNV